MAQVGVKLDDLARETLKQARARLGHTQQTLSELIGVSRNILAKWEAGLSSPSPESLDALCDALGLEWHQGSVVICPKEQEKSTVQRGQSKG